MADSDPVIPGLCAFLLGLCYEFNREPGEITRSVLIADQLLGFSEWFHHCNKRSTIHPIITRLGVDVLIGRITQLRSDDRFKAVGPDTVVLPYPNQVSAIATGGNDSGKQAEIWFDWAFVDFWKSNYCASFVLFASWRITLPRSNA